MEPGVEWRNGKVWDVLETCGEMKRNENSAQPATSALRLINQATISSTLRRTRSVGARVQFPSIETAEIDRRAD